MDGQDNGTLPQRPRTGSPKSGAGGLLPRRGPSYTDRTETTRSVLGTHWSGKVVGCRSPTRRKDPPTEPKGQVFRPEFGQDFAQDSTPEEPTLGLVTRREDESVPSERTSWVSTQ